MKIALRVPGHKRILSMLLLSLVYFITARIGFSLYTTNTFAALMWPPSGIAFAALVLYGEDLWPGIALAAFLATFSIGGTAVSSFFIAIGNTLEAYLAALALRRFGGGESFNNIQAALVFSAIALSTPLISATIGVESLVFEHLISRLAVPDTWSTWWGGDVVGIMVFAPLIMVWFGKVRSHISISYAELYAVLISTVVIGLFVFWGPADTPRLYVVTIPLAWAALRLGMRGKSFTLFITTVIAVSGTLAGNGPFQGYNIGAALASLEFFIMITAITYLIVACIIEDGARTRGELEEYVSELEMTIQDGAQET